MGDDARSHALGLHALCVIRETPAPRVDALTTHVDSGGPGGAGNGGDDW